MENDSNSDHVDGNNIGGHAGIAVNSPQTGDSIPGTDAVVLFLEIAAGIIAACLFGAGKKCERK